MELDTSFLNFFYTVRRFRDPHDVRNIEFLAFFEVKVKIRCLWSFHNEEVERTVLNEGRLGNSVHGPKIVETVIRSAVFGSERSFSSSNLRYTYPRCTNSG